ncbi:MAG TPA: PadR family transcriptional regulator [Solirubrobacterales bacterium]|nr:PadR family transcriptional regulator [Solirubrobacterales bacterium]
MSSEIRLTPTSYIVLGLLGWMGEATPYELKRVVEERIGNFWSVPHSQIYREPGRLVEGGYVRERRERAGRRRRLFSLTDAGQDALAAWRDEPTDELPELRDLSLLKMFFGGDPAALAAAQLAAHERKLAAYRELATALEASAAELPPGPARTLRAGLRHEEEWVEFWRAF